MEKKYFNLQVKSVFRVYPAIILVTLLTVISIAITCFFLLATNKEKDEKQKISIGVVGDMENTYLEIGFNALKNLESSRFFVSVIEMDNEEEAIEALEDREISGYVYIPYGYVESVFQGKNKAARYVTLNAPEGFGTVISTEIAETISDIVVESQNGMYSMQKLAKDYKVKKVNQKVDSLMVFYIDSILNRGNTMEIEYVGVANALSMGGYYICGFLLLFMLLWGISCNRIFSSRNLEFAKKINVSGVGATKQVLCEYLAFLLMSVITFLVFALIFGIVVQFYEINIPELEGIMISDCLFFVIVIVPVLVMITMIHSAIYEFVRNPIAAVLVQFVFAIVMGYFSGCFYPHYFFPDVVQEIATILPVGTGFSFMRKIMSGSIPVLETLIIWLYSIVFFCITVFVRKRRIIGDVK